MLRSEDLSEGVRAFAREAAGALAQSVAEAAITRGPFRSRRAGGAATGDGHRRAVVHHDVETRRARPLGRRHVDHAELHPHRLRAERDRLVDVRARVVGAPEDVDHVDRAGRGEIVDGDVAGRVRVDPDHVLAEALEQRRDAVRVA